MAYGDFKEVSHLVGSGSGPCPDGSDPPCQNVVSKKDIASVTNPDKNVSALSTEFKSKDEDIVVMDKTRKNIKTYDPSKEKGSRISTTEIDPNADKVKLSSEEKKIKRYAKRHNLGIYAKADNQKKIVQYNQKREGRINARELNKKQRKAKIKNFFSKKEKVNKSGATDTSGVGVQKAPGSGQSFCTASKTGDCLKP